MSILKVIGLFCALGGILSIGITQVAIQNGRVVFGASTIMFELLAVFFALVGIGLLAVF